MGFRPQKSVRGEREQPPEAGEHGPQGGGPSPEVVARLARPKEGGLAAHPGPAAHQSCSPGWCSAFYEADCFGADVHSYVKALATQKAGAAPDADAQSLVSPGLPPAAVRPGEGLLWPQRHPGQRVPRHSSGSSRSLRRGGARELPPAPDPCTRLGALPVRLPGALLCSSVCVLHIRGGRSLSRLGTWAAVTVAGGLLVLAITAGCGPCLWGGRQAERLVPGGLLFLRRQH